MSHRCDHCSTVAKASRVIILCAQFLPSVGHRGLIARAINHATKRFTNSMVSCCSAFARFVFRTSACCSQLASADANQGTGPSAGVELLVSALKKDCKKVHINLSEKLAAISLADFPQICLPSGDLVDNIASKAASLVDKGVKKPFICVELKDFLPYWAHDKRDDESSEGASISFSSALVLIAFYFPSR